MKPFLVSDSNEIWSLKNEWIRSFLFFYDIDISHYFLSLFSP